MGPLYLIIWSGNVGERQEREKQGQKKKKKGSPAYGLLFVCLSDKG